MLLFILQADLRLSKRIPLAIHSAEAHTKVVALHPSELFNDEDYDDYDDSDDTHPSELGKNDEMRMTIDL